MSNESGGSPAQRGKFMRSVIYLVSPRLLASPELLKKHGAFSLHYHKSLWREIKESLQLIRDKKDQRLEWDINNIAERKQRFYDYLYESGVTKSNVVQMHVNFRKRAKGYALIAAFISLIGFSTFFIGQIAIFPAWVLGAATLAYAASFFFKVKEQHYFAWLIEQRLSPGSVSVLSYARNNLFKWPKADLGISMLKEIETEYAARNEMVRNGIASGDSDALALANVAGGQR
jgi:hypothetical protein